MESRPSRIGIVGAGLAGLLSAKWIKEKNPEIEIEILERRKREKYRIDCAEALLNQRKAFERVGKLVEPFITNRLYKVLWRMELEGELRFSTIHYPDPPCWMVDRLSWQKQLIEDLENSGVKIIFGKRADPEEILDDYELVVDARGSFKPGKYCASGVYSIFSGNFQKIADTMISETREGSGVYYWVFPINPQLANIGCGSHTGFIRRKFLDEYLEELPGEMELEEEIKRGAGLVDFSYGAMLYHGEEKVVVDEREKKGVVRVGDAAGLADPLTGEGMTGAISSAYWLAHTLTYRDLREYVRLLRSENEFLARNMGVEEARKNYYPVFVKFMTILDGVNGRYLDSKLFMLRYPIRALKLRFS